MTINAQLGTLEGASVIRLAALQPEVEYAFRHGLMQEAAYSSLVKSDRRTVHRAVGETLERLYLAARARPAHNLLPELAHHFAEANDPARALDYYTRAGDAAFGLYANAEAIAHYTRALQFALPDRAGAVELAHLFDRRGRAQELNGRYDAALENYAQWEAEGRRRGDRALTLGALTRRVVVHAVPSDHFDPGRALALSEPALAEAAALGDRQAEARLRWAVMLAHAGAGDAPSAVVSGQRALDLARSLDHRELLALTLTDLSRMYAAVGRTDEGVAALAEAHGLWRALGNLPMLAETYTNAGGLHFYRGRYDLALEVLAEGLLISESIGNAWGRAYNLMQQFFILFDQGKFSPAIRAMRQCLALSREGGFVYPLVTGRALLGLIYGLLGQPKEAVTLLEAAQRAVEEILPVERASLVLIWAWLLILQGDLERAERLTAEGRQALIPDDYLSPNPVILAIVEGELALRRGQPEAALQAARRFEGQDPKGIMATFQPDLLRLHGAALLALGRTDEALATLLRAHAQAASQPSYRSLWMICGVLAQAAGHQGDASAARRWRAEARHHLEFLIAHVEEPELRASFLQQPDVRATVAAAEANAQEPSVSPA